MLYKLEIKGFRGITRTIEFGRATLLSGGNGQGKTNALDAIRWCFVGVDGEDKANNNVFNNHKVNDGTKETVGVRCSLVDDDGVETVFGRTATRKGDKVDYTYIYGEIEVPAKKYADLVEKAMLPIPQLKFILNVRRWEQLDESVLRDALLGLYDGSDIICDPAYKKIREEIEVSGLKDTKKRLRKDMKTLQGSLDTIQIELNMAEQTVPEAIEIGDLQNRLYEREQELKRLDESPSEIPAELRDKIQGEAKHISELETEYEMARQNHHVDYAMRLQELKASYEQAKTDKRMIERLIAERDNDTALVENGKRRLEELKSEYDDVLKRVFDGACPCCGRPYEGDQRDELMAEHMKKKDDAIAKIKEQAKRVKNNAEDAKARIDAYDARLKEIKSSDPNALLNEIKRIEAEGEQAFATTEKGKSLQAAIDDAKANRVDVSGYDKERVNKIASLRDEIFALKMRFADAERLRKEREDGLRKVDEIKARRAEVVKRHTEAESDFALANRYEISLLQGLQDYLNDMLNAGTKDGVDTGTSIALNSTLISLYRIDDAGDVTPQCKIISGGVSDTINNSKRTTIGLRLAEALIRKSGKDIPVLIDNVEAFDKKHMPKSDYQLIMSKVDADGEAFVVSDLSK